MNNTFLPPWFAFKSLFAFMRGLDRLRGKLTPPPLRLLEMIGGYAPTQIVRAAAELGIADHLVAGPKSVPELAVVCGADEEALSRLMRALCSLDLCRKGERRETFVLGALGEYLRSDRPDSLRATVIATGREQYGGMAGLTESVRHGKATFPSLYGTDFFSRLEHYEDSGVHFADSMAEISRACLPAILAEYDFSSIGHLIDVGGGTGTLLKGILARYPRLEGTLFDQPSVIERGKPDAGLLSRCRLVAGDMFEEVPAGGDAYMMQRVLHDWDDEQAIQLLANCRRVMPSNGRLILLEFGIGREENEFVRFHADLLMLSLLGGRERTEEEFRVLLDRAGFCLHCVIETRSPIRIYEAFPARWGY
ncbi:MAG: hypothetical protein HYS23_00870 [Geobacter sp.]|nr:hypothetical protein [Geobacter sp.]